MADPAAYSGTTPTVILESPGDYPGSTDDLVVVRRSGIDKVRIDYLGRFSGSVSGCYGGMYVSNESAATVALTTGGTFYPVVASVTEGLVSGPGFVTFDTDHLVVGTNGAGVYSLRCSFSGILSATDTADFAIFKGTSIQQNMRSDQSVTNQTAYASGCITGLISLVAGDTISLRAACDGGSKTLSVHHMNLNIVRIG